MVNPSDDQLVAINQKLGLKAIDANHIREMYDNVDLRYMVLKQKEPPTAQQLSTAFGKYVLGVRQGDENWTQFDADALDYSILAAH